MQLETAVIENAALSTFLFLLLTKTFNDLLQWNKLSSDCKYVYNVHFCLFKICIFEIIMVSHHNLTIYFLFLPPKALIGLAYGHDVT